MSRLDRVREILRLEGLAAAARERATVLRAQLEHEAHAEYLREGTAPSWRMPDIGVVTLPVSEEAVVVDDPAALLRWCGQRRPDQVHEVLEVYPSFQTWLTENCTVEGDVVALPDTGEVVPGLAVRPGGQPGSISIRPGRGVRQVCVELGARLLDDILDAGPSKDAS